MISSEVFLDDHVSRHTFDNDARTSCTAAGFYVPELQITFQEQKSTPTGRVCERERAMMLLMII